MVKKILLSLFWMPLMLSCDVSSPRDENTLSETQRQVLLEAGSKTLAQLKTQGYELRTSQADSESQSAQIGDRILVEYSGNMSLAASPEELAPAITLSRINGPRSLSTSGLSQEKYLLTGLEWNRERSEVERIVFTRVAPTASATELRQVKFSSRRNDWIEVIRLAKDSSHRAVSENVYIDDFGAAQIGDLFTELQKGLEELQ
ncbi:MAG TPA: hypothetical protein VM901_12735 [Bdellovibrionota bacterium]|nr:hypothetical protein [Bdellovibrionota bacterium]